MAEMIRNPNDRILYSRTLKKQAHNVSLNPDFLLTTDYRLQISDFRFQNFANDKRERIKVQYLIGQ